ncbi:Syntaxin-5-like [Homarus americanus]|uniref:Syntaxin-5-like n=1 Tax=Homarus americanus TaxID=6706 RepID=A0A8J5JL44_HOMAM|nr:Syntaxin-5-like [Homarus americanus]
MTTRRRRAGSESYVEEPTVPGASTVQKPQQPHAQPTLTQSPYSLYPQVANAVNNNLQWGSATCNSQAYYKKTDTVDPGGVGQVAAATTPYTGQPWPTQPTQPYFYTPQGNSNTQSGGTFYGTDNKQWNPSTSGANSSSNNQWSNSGTHWNTGAVSNSETLNKTHGSGGHLNRSASDWSSVGSHLSSIDDVDMASRDRTQEFARIVRSQQGSYTNGVLPHHEGKRPRDLHEYKDFMQRAKLIGRNISMAKKRSLFDDSHDREIQELTGIIRHDLTSLTKQLGDLRNRSLAASSTGNSAHLQKHSRNLVGSLQSKVASITRMFKDVLEVRTENLKKQAERREQFTGGIVSGELPPGAVAGHHQGSVLLADEAAAAAYTSSGETVSSNGEVAINLGNGGAYQQQLQLMEEQDTYLQSRADTMRTIESTIVELGQMFTQLATMVKEQEELVHRIDANVDETGLNVEAAHSELLKYFKSVSSNRMLMIKVFGIMIVFFVIFVVFMA